MDKSKRNRFAGKHPSYKKKKMSKESIAKKRAYQREYNKTEGAKKHRAELNKKNRDSGTYGNGDKKDASHSADGKSMTMEDQSKNRARSRPRVRQSRSPRKSRS